MSSEIIIFQSPEETDHVVKEHRDIEYEKLITDLGPENSYHADHLLDMIDKNSANKSFWINSNILSILTKQVITYCKPIISNIPHQSDSGEKETLTNDKTFFIQLQMNHEIDAFIISKEDMSEKNISIPSDIPFRVIGVKIPKLLIPVLDYSLINSVHPVLTDIRELYRSGSYNYELQIRNKNNIAPYTQQLLATNFNDYTCQPLVKPETIMFNNKEETQVILENILTKLTLMREYYSKFLPFYIIVKIPDVIKTNIYSSIKQGENKIPAELKDSLYYPYAGEYGLNEKLIGEGLFSVYNKMAKLGTNNEDIQTSLKLKQIENKNRRERILQTKEISTQIVDDFKKQSIVNRKFPNRKYRDLNPKEQETITKEFELLKRKSKFIRDREVRKIVHEFLRSFETINTAESLQKAYDNLNSMVKEKSIELKDIGICEHNTRQADLLLDGYKTGTIYKSKSSFDIRETLIKEFTTLETLINDEYFCKICGQLIASEDTSEVVDFAGEQRLNTGHEFDALEELIYRDVSHIIRTYVKFKNLVDIRPIIKSMTSTLTPEMHVIETKLKQIQTNISDDMRDLMGMYIYIYTFALVSHMILVNYGQITFAFREGAFGGSASDLIFDDGDDTTGGDANPEESLQERLQNILRNALYLINSTKIKLLKSSSNIGPDKVKPILLQAYQWVTKLQTYKGKEYSMTDVNFEILNSIISSSIYGYLWTVKSIVSPKTKLQDLPAVIGTDLDTIRNANHKSKKEKINPFKSAYVFSEKEWKKTGNQYYDKYTYESYLQSINYEKNETYKTLIIPLSDLLQKHYDKAKELLKIEKRLQYQSRFIENNRAFNSIKRTFEYQRADTVKFNIGRFYKPDGTKRSWHTLVLAPKNSNDNKTIEVTSEELLKMEYEKRISFKIVDRKDDSEYLSEIKDYSKSINEKFAQTDYNKGLLEYFENRCPSGGIHEFENSDICNKCHRDMNPKWIHTDSAISYVKLHTSAFNKHNTLKSHLVLQELEKLKKLTKTKEYKFPEFGEWKYSELQILEWSRISPKVNINMILNLGCSEGRKYYFIEKERDNPVKEYNNIDHLGRVSKLDSYYNSTIREYYSVKNYQLADSPPIHFITLIDKYKDILTKLPDIADNDYNHKLEWYKMKHSSEMHIVCNFILVQIANIMNTVSQVGPHGKLLAEILTTFIITKEKLFSKPEPFKITIDKRTKDDEYQSDSSSEGSDADDDIIVDSPMMSEAESDINEQNQETEAYNFGLENTAIDDVNDGNDDDGSDSSASEA
jgi:hypothetical protein